MIPYSCKNVDTTGKFWFIPGVPGTMFIKNEKPDPNTGNHYTIVDHSWKAEKHPQPNALVKHIDPKKMNRIEYMEKLVQHKLAKWECKHPKPDDELFNDVEQWKQERETALERFRDFVVSIYDKLPLIGRYKNGDHKFKEELVAELKDKDGEGHKVNELKPRKSKLLDEAQKITNKAHAKNINLVATNLRDHKRQRGRIILPQAA